MVYKFSKLHIHHFLSFDDATIDLTDKGYCFIRGINKNPKDAARSNGSGKSTIANALAFALIGETISGLKSNLGNIYFNDGCYVELEFYVDNNKYNLLRSRDDSTYGTNLKVFVNDEDKSGKGIRESQAVLDEILPDLTRELIGSVILLGQGLPDRFTANSPSGRKEVLEHLSKSDFMIQDLKQRIERRSSELSVKMRELEDSELANLSQKSVYEQQAVQAKQKLDSLFPVPDFEKDLGIKRELRDSLKTKFDNNETQLARLREEKKTLNESLLEKTTIKSEKLASVYRQYIEFDKELSSKKVSNDLNISNLEKEITSLKNIRDVCPTCGQKIPGAVKPDTTAKEEELTRLRKEAGMIRLDIEDNNNEYNRVKADIETKFNNETADLRTKLTNIERDEVLYSNTSTTLELDRINREIVAIEKDKESHNQKIKEASDLVTSLGKTLVDIDKKDLEIKSSKTELSKHIAIVNKMNTYIKRDFRGILLSNSINYINKKAKEYSTKIFNTDEVEFKLDGNNIDIIFCGKDYENLSGGEKQRIDLITQFAIRDMLSKQLGFSSNILFLDEITDNLDRDSCDKVINFITMEFKDIESTFIISHHSDLDIPYDSEIVVVKDAMGVTRI